MTALDENQEREHEVDRPQALSEGAHWRAREFVSFMLFCFDFFEMFEKHVVNATLKTRYQWPELFSPSLTDEPENGMARRASIFSDPREEAGAHYSIKLQKTRCPEKKPCRVRTNPHWRETEREKHCRLQ
jgi:hypothetical protein